MAAYDGITAPEILVEVFDASGSYIDNFDPALIRAIDTHRGRARDDQKNDVGTCTVVLDNSDGQFDPDNSSSVWWDGVNGISYLRGGTQVKVKMSWEANSYPLFTGFMESLSMDIGLTPTVTITFVDAMSRFGNTATGSDASLLFDTEWDGSSTDVFLALIAATDVVNYVGSFDWAPGCDVLCQAFREAKSFRDVIDDLCTLEAGRWYITAAGDFWFEPLAGKFDRTVKLLLSDSRAAGTIEYDEISVQSGALQLCNVCVINVPDDSGTSSEIHAGYEPSRSVFGRYARTLDAPFYSDLQGEQAAAYYARTHAFPGTLVESVSFTAFALDDYIALLGTELGDYIEVDRTTVDGRALQYLLVVEGIDHSITPDEWRVTFATSAANDVSATIAVTP